MQQGVLEILQDFSPESYVQPVDTQLFEPLIVNAGHEFVFDRREILDDSTNCREEANKPHIEEFQNEEPQLAVTTLLKEHENILADLKKHYEDRIDELISTHQQDVISVMANIHIQAIDGLVAQVEQNIADAMAPLMKGRVAEANVEAMIAEITRALKVQTIDKMRLTGPVKLIAPVKAALDHLNLTIEIEECDVVDLTVSIDKQAWSTSLNEWSYRLEGLLEDE